MKASGTLEQRLRAHIQPTVLLKSRQEAPFYKLVEPLGIPVAKARFYTAFRRDGLSSDSSRNPALPRIPIAGGSPPRSELDRARRQQLDWESDDLAIDGFAGRFPHRKVQLDEASGIGAVNLADE